MWNTCQTTQREAFPLWTAGGEASQPGHSNKQLTREKGGHPRQRAEHYPGNARVVHSLLGTDRLGRCGSTRCPSNARADAQIPTQLSTRMPRHFPLIVGATQSGILHMM